MPPLIITKHCDGAGELAFSSRGWRAAMFNGRATRWVKDITGAVNSTMGRGVRLWNCYCRLTTAPHWLKATFWFCRCRPHFTFKSKDIRHLRVPLLPVGTSLFASSGTQRGPFTLVRRTWSPQVDTMQGDPRAFISLKLYLVDSLYHSLHGCMIVE